MTTLLDRPAIIETAPTWHYCQDGDPLRGGDTIFDGLDECAIAAHTLGDQTVYSDVAPGHALPGGWRWATAGELATILASHPGAHVINSPGDGAVWGLASDPERLDEVFAAAATHIERYGRHAGDFASRDGLDCPTAATCAAGAINVVTVGKPAFGEAHPIAQHAGLLANLAAKDALCRALGVDYRGFGDDGEPIVPDGEEAFDFDEAIAGWNDEEPDDRVVIALFRRLAAEHAA